MEQFLAIVAAELIVLLVHRLIQLVFGTDLPGPLAKLAA